MTLQYSIVVLTKDRPQLLRRSVNSALENLTDKGELLIIDDHSALSARDCLSDIVDRRMHIASLPEGETGIATARNAGFSLANGDVVFFLDDDDKMEPGYCQSVLNDALERCDYGFSAYSQVTNEGDYILRARFDHGPIPDCAPLRKKTCGFGMGFWIKAIVAKEIGPVSTNLSINEDTDYVCRLITVGKRAWYNATPSITIFTGHRETSDLANVTHTTAPNERARCMRILCDRYPQMVDHLGASYIRHCTKYDAQAEAWSFIREQSDWRVRGRLASLLLVKTVAYHLLHWRRSNGVTKPRA